LRVSSVTANNVVDIGMAVSGCEVSGGAHPTRQAVARQWMGGLTDAGREVS
jgi:hypothetical protein